MEHVSEYLSSNLAHVTAMDPLRITILSHAKSFVTSTNLTTLVGDNLIQSAVEDNLELATAYVEKASIEKSKFGLDALILSGHLQGERVELVSPQTQVF